MRERTLNHLLEEHGTNLLEYLRLSLPDLADAQDVYQETVVAIWQAFDSFENNSNVKTWMIGIAKRKVADFYRKRKVTESIAESATKENDFEETIELKLAIQSLSRKDRKLLFYIFQLGLSHTEIAELEQIPVGTIKSRFYHLKTKLQRLLEVKNASSP